MPSHYGIWRSDALPGVELQTVVNPGITCRLVQSTYAFCIIPRRDNPDGDLATWRYRGQDHVYRPQMVGMEEPGEVHDNTAVRVPISLWLLLVDPALAAAASDELERPSAHFSLAESQHPALYDTFARFYAAVRAGGNDLELQTRLAACLRAAFAIGGEGAAARSLRPLTSAGLRRALDYLRAHFVEPVQLDVLADVAGVSKYHFARQFTAACGMPPHAYQNQLRLHAVRAQLRAGVPLERIDSGFFDLSHLTRHLKRSWCITPGQYMKPAAASLPDWH